MVSIWHCYVFSFSIHSNYVIFASIRKLTIYWWKRVPSKKMSFQSALVWFSLSEICFELVLAACWWFRDIPFQILNHTWSILAMKLDSRHLRCQVYRKEIFYSGMPRMGGYTGSSIRPEVTVEIILSLRLLLFSLRYRYIQLYVCI